MIAAFGSTRSGSTDVDVVECRLARIARIFGAPAIDQRRGQAGIFGWDAVRPARALGGAGVVLGSLERQTLASFIDAGESLRGNFALVGWHRSGGVVAARGPLGGEPLFWWRDGDAWIIASRLDAILAALDSPPQVDVAHLATFSAGLLALGDDLAATPYAGIRRFLSCERRVFSHAALAGSAEMRLWTNVQMDAELEADAEAVARELWREVTSSVRRAMSGVRVVGVLTGGGVDSSGLLAAAVEVARETRVMVVPLAIDFAGDGDDRPHRHVLERALGVTAVTVTPEDAAPYVTSSLVADGLPSLYASLPLICAAAESARRHGVQRILTGFLGDLILDAPHDALLQHALSRTASAGLSDAIRSALRYRAPWTSTPVERLRRMLVKPLLRRWIPTAALLDRRRRSFSSYVPWAGPAMHDAITNVARSHSPHIPHRTPHERYAALATHPLMVGQIETRAQLEILCGVAFAEPWMDDTFVRFLSRVPSWTMAHGDWDRGLFRHAMKGHVPDSVRLRPDKASIEPALDRMLVSAEDRDRLRALGDGNELSRRGIVDAAKLARSTAKLVACQGDPDARDRDGAGWTALWPVLASEALLEGLPAS